MLLLQYRRMPDVANCLAHCLLCWDRYIIALLPDHISAGAYNENIDKWLTSKLVWPHETSPQLAKKETQNALIDGIRGPCRRGTKFKTGNK